MRLTQMPQQIRRHAELHIRGDGVGKGVLKRNPRIRDADPAEICTRREIYISIKFAVSDFSRRSLDLDS